MSAPPVKSNTRQEQRLHPLPVRVMHWTNAVAIFIMIGSGWKIYNDDVLFGFLHFPDAVVIGKWAQYGLQWHFFGMWIFVINGLAYLIYGIATGRFRQKLFPLSLREILATVGDALRFRLAHEDLTHYNAVQKILYLGIMAVGVLIVISGLALWKPVRFSEGVVVRQLPDHPARAFPLHGGDRWLFADPRDARVAGAEKPGRHADRRPGRRR